MSNLKEEFISLLRSTEREGVDDVIEELEELGFFTAPASTRFHLCKKEGLLEHSLNVCHVAMKVREAMLAMDDSLLEYLPKSSVIIATLLHDACKAEIYKPVMKRKKDEFGRWADVPGYDVDYSELPLGHGEKSVVRLLRCGMDLTDDEILAIRWHMSAWDMPFQSSELKENFNEAKRQCPLLSLVMAADGLSSNLLERDEED